MAKPEHLEILKQGVDAWNRWREGNPTTVPDLSGANLTQVYLGGAHFNRVDLTAAILRQCHMSVAELSGTNLTDADLSEAHLTLANFTFANLARANLSGAWLSRVDFSNARVGGASFQRAGVGYAKFGNIDLSQAKHLETIRDAGPSIIGIDTIYLSKGDIPEAFLRGAGVPDDFIVYMWSLAAHPIEFYSCFISYSSKDDDFARRLHADLQQSNVRCWFAPEDLKIGDKFRTRIDESVRLYDKLMVILTEHSIASLWVEEEVEAAIEKERKSGKTVLFPIRLDDAVMETDQAWAASLRRTRHIGDFRNWKDHDAFKKAFERLLRDLKGSDKSQQVTSGG